MDNSGVIQR